MLYFYQYFVKLSINLKLFFTFHLSRFFYASWSVLLTAFMSSNSVIPSSFFSSELAANFNLPFKVYWGSCVNFSLLRLLKIIFSAILQSFLTLFFSFCTWIRCQVLVKEGKGRKYLLVNFTYKFLCSNFLSIFLSN